MTEGMNDREKNQIQRDVYVTLRDHFEALQQHQDQRIDQAFKSVHERINDTDQRLREHVTLQLNQISSTLEAARRETGMVAQSAREAVEKAERAQEKRLDLLNEFRAQAGDEAKKYALRENVDQTDKERSDRITKIESSVARLYGGLLVLALVGVANIVKIFA